MSVTRIIGSVIVKEHGQFFTKKENNWLPISTELKCCPGVWRISRALIYPYPLLFSHTSFDPSNIGNPDFIKYNKIKLLNKFESGNQIKFSCCQDNTLKTDSVINIFPGVWGLYSHNFNWTKFIIPNFKWFIMDMEDPDCEADFMLDKLLLK